MLLSPLLRVAKAKVDLLPCGCWCKCWEWAPVEVVEEVMGARSARLMGTGSSSAVRRLRDDAVGNA